MQRTLWNAFKNFAIILSFIINFVLIIVVLVIGIELFTIKNGILEPLIDGLHGNFVALDNANIIRQIAVQDEIPVAFTLMVQDSTEVTITENVQLSGPATFNLPGGGGTITGQVYMTLQEGQALPIALSLPVDVDEMVPVNLLVDVEIPLKETQLHEPFYALRNLFEPFVVLIDALPDSYEEAGQLILGGGPGQP